MLTTLHVQGGFLCAWKEMRNAVLRGDRRGAAYGCRRSEIRTGYGEQHWKGGWESGRRRTSRDRITGMDEIQRECCLEWCGDASLLQGTRGREGMLCIRDVGFRGAESGAARVENTIRSYII